MSVPQKYRKKPVVIEAIEFTGSNAKEVANWVQDHGHRALGDPDGVTIITLEGNMLARPGWWIIKGVQGEFYPCDPEIFAKTYEKETN